MELTKREARAQALALRDGLSAAERERYSECIVKNLTDYACYQEATALLTYVSFRSEVDTTHLIEQALAVGKAVFVPRVMGQEMDFFRIVSFADLEEGYRGILEPKARIATAFNMRDMAAERTLICMPGAAFDRAHHRIGYGGGYYDRYLTDLLAGASHSVDGRIVTAALAFACQILPEIPREAHDISPEFIVTETGIF